VLGLGAFVIDLLDIEMEDRPEELVEGGMRVGLDKAVVVSGDGIDEISDEARRSWRSEVMFSATLGWG